MIFADRCRNHDKTQIGRQASGSAEDRLTKAKGAHIMPVRHMPSSFVFSQNVFQQLSFRKAVIAFVPVPS